MGRSQRVPKNQVVTAAESGLPASVIAERLECSAGHVRRLLRAEGVEATPNALAGTPEEWRLWQHYRDLGESYGTVAYRFCVSRQAVQQRLEREELRFHAQAT